MHKDSFSNRSRNLNAGVKREGKISWNTSVLDNWKNTFGFNRNSKVWETKYCFQELWELTLKQQNEMFIKGSIGNNVCWGKVLVFKTTINYL